MPSLHDLYLTPVDPGDETCSRCGGSVDGSDLCETIAVARAAGHPEAAICIGCCDAPACEECDYLLAAYAKKLSGAHPAPVSHDDDPGTPCTTLPGVVVTPTFGDAA